MENVAFNISERTEKGKKVRKNGEVPCVVYGEDVTKSTPVKMSRRDVDKLLTCPKSSMFSLNLNGKVENSVGGRTYGIGIVLLKNYKKIISER